MAKRAKKKIGATETERKLIGIEHVIKLAKIESNEIYAELSINSLNKHEINFISTTTIDGKPRIIKKSPNLHNICVSFEENCKKEEESNGEKKQKELS